MIGGFGYRRARLHRVRLAVVLGGLCATTGLSQTSTFDFVLDRIDSGMSADILFSVDTTGTLIGDYDARTNVEGTRTKPGLFGPFGPTENVPVDAGFGVSLEGDVQTSAAGGFRLVMAAADGIVELSNYEVDFLNGDAVSLPATLTVGFDTFRTRSPDSLYIGAILPLPLGELAVTSLNVSQVGGPVLGTLEAVSPNEYVVTVVVLAEFAITLSFLGTPLEVPPTPILLPLQGSLVLSPTGATFSSMLPLEVQMTTEPGLALPAIPFELPTILPPGQTAGLLLSLTLTEVGASVVGGLTMSAEGSLVILGDCSGDGLVDSTDFGAWVECFTGPDELTPTDCACGDIDDDGRADLSDFAVFQIAFDGP